MKDFEKRYLNARREYLLTTFEGIIDNERVKTIFGTEMEPELLSTELWDVVIHYIRDKQQPNFYIEELNEENKMSSNNHYFMINPDEFVKIALEKENGSVKKMSKDEVDQDIQRAVINHSNIGFNNTKGKYLDLCYSETLQAETDDEKDIIVFKDIHGHTYKQDEIIWYVDQFTNEMKPIEVSRNNERDIL